MPTKKVFICSNCHITTSKWQGRCPNCSEWNTLVESVVESKPKQQTLTASRSTDQKPQTLSEIWAKQSSTPLEPYRFHSQLLNDFWGGGIHPGSITLLAGEPGLGKSTLGLQLLRSIFVHKKQTVWYITAEESNQDMARRAKRLDIPGEITLLQANDWNRIASLLRSQTPDLIVVDSIQTVFHPDIGSNPGSVSQVTTIVSQLLDICKSQTIAAIVIGHVTKEGQIAGPKTLEHLVDSVVQLESSDQLGYRTLSFTKHRFGSTQTMLLLKMEEKGLEIVTDPSLALLENLESGSGVSYGLALDKNLPLIVEIQCLVSAGEPSSNNWYGRREALGLQTAKLNTLLAIMEKYLGIEVKSRDIYLQLNGLPKNTLDDSLDLPIILALYSSLIHKPLSEIFSLPTKKQLVFAGRVTLSGSLRVSTQENVRQETAKKLGFVFNPSIEPGELHKLFNLFGNKRSH